MAGRSTLDREFFTAPQQANHRRYEALRAVFVDGLSHTEAGQRFGYTRAAMASLARDWRAGKLDLFAPPRKPGPAPGTAPARERVRGRIVALRRQGLSVYEISARLAAEGTPLNRTSVGEILTEEGFGRLLRHPAPEASAAPATPGRDTTLPPVAPLDFTTLPDRCHTTVAGLLLVLPDLLTLDLPALVAAGYPGTRTVPAISWLLSLLSLKLSGTRRVSHVDDHLLIDPAAALFAGLAVLPKKTALTDYSYRLSREHQRRFLTGLDTSMIGAGLATTDEAIFDLDFHAVMHWGNDPVLEKHYVPTRSQRSRSVLTFFAQDSGTHNLVYANADLSKATQNAGNHSKPKVHESAAVKLTGYPGTVRQFIITGLGRDTATVIITNDDDTTAKHLIGRYARRMTIEQRLAEIIRAFHADALSSTVNLNVDLDITLCVLAQALLAALRQRLPGYATVTPDTLQRRFLDTPGEIINHGDTITIKLNRRAYSPVLRQADLPTDLTIPWWGNRTLRYQIA